MLRQSWIPVVLLPVVLLTSACGVKEKLEQRVREEVAEKVIEAAANGEVDVETRDGKLTVINDKGESMHLDGEDGKVVVTDADGKTHVYDQGPDGSATLKSSDGLDAEIATEIPKDFPLALPPVREVQTGHRVETPDGAKIFSVAAWAKSDDLAEVSAAIVAQFEAKGLTVEQSEIAANGDTAKMIQARDADGKIEASATLTKTKSAAESGKPGVMMVVSWSDKRAVAG